jgi:lipopolysaccharide assembly protein A
MRLVHWLVTLPAAIILVIFAISNREHVTVAFWPLPARLEAPLYLVVLLALLAGFLFGELVAWINGRRARRLARQRARRIEALERELAATQANLAAPPPSRATPLVMAGNAREGSRD